MGNNLYNDFSNDAPIEFKTKFIKVHRYYIIYSRASSCLTVISTIYPLCAGSMQQIILQTSNENKYLADGLSISIPILVLVFIVVFALVRTCQRFQKIDVDNLLKFTQYFKVIPNINMEDQLGPNIFSSNDFKLLQFKYH